MSQEIELSDADIIKFIRIVFNTDCLHACWSCGNCIDPEYVYCPWCGKKNRLFSPEDFEATYGTDSISTVAEKNCLAEHAAIEKVMLEDLTRTSRIVSERQPAEFIFFSYCTLCGKDCMSRQ